MRKITALLQCLLVLASCTTASKQESATNLNDTISSLGYDSLALPSTAYGPGSLVTSVKGNGLMPPLKLTYLCRPDFAHTPPAIVDQAASSEASGALKGSFQLDATTLAQLGLGAKLSYIRSVIVKLSNVTVEQLAFDDLASVRSQLGPVCQNLVETFSSRSLAYQTKQAIRADVTYSVQLNKGASANVKGLVLHALTAAFGGSIESDSDLTATGKGLFYGLVLTKV
ncbi:MULTISPECIES: hypothetical protein [unclassified Mesorhizobium]|uniref:hypothetical protein n=1 Tax=unclassified Mesorhizobium TaxID=325217 RepID=UPI00112C0707|nr:MULTISPECIES: hypothetical protein [unclassified Mesorhizobium]MBZ9701630.1 hypothetical protein [Mesorhizobium sp. CO1-1-3]MBZ9948977.1 hypothetical protein [Mesorhizobium sp. BR1-1-11]TPI99564.1 hypothetical protein FJ428_21750 [Mesorhizobium sp. B2-8-1]